MSNVFQFPPSRQAPARQIPREEFERLAELALDVVDRIVAMLDEPDRSARAEDVGCVVRLNRNDQDRDRV
ncbi:hypothetical protein ASG51_20255 [Methylobacterium sp. Leaf465]|uniref:hypothetical protein n=1 Tax=Methylobacterium sp. Leaf465 TaxID=1736385 RepID=UPI0006F9F0CD|nr:hypothetical protein [Methylobacterium sp. Leaf465]KQT82081.1 hypothetical protein ASG51_20255 [Methylobacterium sp. Leaf465]